MKIDIIICTYNRASQLRRAIASMLACRVPDGVSVTLIVVDNNSSDETQTIVGGFIGTFQISIRYLFEKKQGKSHALNTALSEISGDLVAFVDDDEFVDQGYLEAIVAAIEQHPTDRCFGGKVIPEYPEHLPAWLDIKGSMKFLKSVFGDRDEGDYEGPYGKRTISSVPGGGNMFFRRDAIEANGLFRADLGPQGSTLGFSEDTEYCMRFMERGERFIYIPGVVVYHHVPPERLTKSYLLDWQYECGRSEVRRRGGYKDPGKIFGVPRYLYRKCVEHVVGRCLSLHEKKRFYHRLRFYYAAGEVREHLAIRSQSVAAQ